MNDLPKLNLPPITLRAKRDKLGRTQILDTVRRQWVVLTPEEWVRRHVAQYMMDYCGFPLQSLAEEYPVALNGTAQRADIVAMDSNGRPLVLVECKEASTAIDHTVFSQAVRYNAVIGCRHIVMTNGRETHCWSVVDGEYRPQREFPRFE
ncbi:MAG: type I restriction enzyme HsdR N-terminal domain-containing protein [Alistipes sp.]|nr:type I restriction enzyme HsdR N-terminal domain-containing protein [Alistipes sp.]